MSEEVFMNAFIDLMEQAAINALFTREADELLGNKMYYFPESQDFTKDLVRHLVKSSTFAVPISRFVKQQAKNSL